LSTPPQDFSGDELARLYQERFSTHELDGKRQLWEALYDGFLRRYVRTSDTVLDLGAGSCEFINACHAETKIAVDLNPETKVWARDARVVLASSDDMTEVDSDSVDVVFTSNFFEHLPDKRALLDTLSECGRVLRPAGRLLILMPNLRYVGSRYWDYFDHHLPMTHASLVEGLNMSGFAADRVIPRFLPYTIKDSPFKIRRAMVRAYLLCPPVWRIFGGQMFVAASKLVPGATGVPISGAPVSGANSVLGAAGSSAAEGGA
jgi:SAM-dependent methyltransferase